MAGSGGRDSGARGGGAHDANQPWYARAGAPEPPWRDLFLGGGPGRILQRLCAGDVLCLGELSEDRLREMVYMIHPDRLRARAMARVAYGAAAGYDGRPPLLAWLRDRVDQSIEELLEEDLEEEQLGHPVEGIHLERYRTLIPPATGIDPKQARRACVFFNELPRAMREPFFRTVLEGWTTEEYAMEHDLSLDDVVRRIQECTRHLVLSVENGQDGKERPAP